MKQITLQIGPNTEKYVKAWRAKYGNDEGLQPSMAGLWKALIWMGMREIKKDHPDLPQIPRSTID